MIERDLQTLADEYVIGLLDEAERIMVEERLADDPTFKAAVADAHDRFLEIDLTERPLPVAAETWERIDASLDQPGSAYQDETIIPFAQAKPIAASSSRPWKLATLAAVAASLVLALGLGWQITRPAPLVVAVLLDSEGEPNVLIEAFADDRARVVPLGEIDIPKGSILEVWTLPDVPDAKPVSLGQLDQVRTRRLQGPDLPIPQKGQLYEITIETVGGSPTGLPTGPIVGKGFAKQRL